jgi:hypothetical protein
MMGKAGDGIPRPSFGGRCSSGVWRFGGWHWEPTFAPPWLVVGLVGTGSRGVGMVKDRCLPLCGCVPSYVSTSLLLLLAASLSAVSTAHMASLYVCASNMEIPSLVAAADVSIAVARCWRIASISHRSVNWR